MKITDKDIILFDGDSITDAGRDRSDKYSLAGYPLIISELLAQMSLTGRSPAVYNRGISGDKSGDVAQRIASTLMDVKPTVYSLLIGVNDVQREYDSGLVTTADQYYDNVKLILDAVKKYTDKIVLLEPFIIPVAAHNPKMPPNLFTKTQKLRELAREYETEYIPLDGIFAELSVNNGASLYSGDSIHLSPTGYSIVAAEWLKRVKLISQK